MSMFVLVMSHYTNILGTNIPYTAIELQPIYDPDQTDPNSPRHNPIGL